MTDLWHKLMQWVDYNRGLVVGLVLALALSAWIAGCQPKAPSVLKPGESVTATELSAEIAEVQAQVATETSALAAKAEALNTKIDISVEEIARQQEQRRQLLEIGGGAAQLIASGQATPASIIGSIIQAIALLGFGGAVYDNRRKDRVIAATTP